MTAFTFGTALLASSLDKASTYNDTYQDVNWLQKIELGSTIESDGITVDLVNNNMTIASTGNYKIWCVPNYSPLTDDTDIALFKDDNLHFNNLHNNTFIGVLESGDVIDFRSASGMGEEVKLNTVRFYVEQLT